MVFHLAPLLRNCAKLSWTQAVVEESLTFMCRRVIVALVLFASEVFAMLKRLQSCRCSCMMSFWRQRSQLESGREGQAMSLLWEWGMGCQAKAMVVAMGPHQARAKESSCWQARTEVEARAKCKVAEKASERAGG